MPITLPTGTTIRTVTFWYPADHLGIDDWRVPLKTLFDADFRPQRRLLALPTAERHRDLLAAPAGGDLVRCAGGPLRLLDIAASGARAAGQATSRYEQWLATGRIGTCRPDRTDAALLSCGRRTYVSYHLLRRIVGDALIVMRDGARLYPADDRPQTLVDYAHQAIMMLSYAHPDDVLVTVAT